MSVLTEEEARRQLQAAGRYMHENGLAWGNAGNISARVGNSCLVSASGTQLGSLAEDDLVAVQLDPSAPGEAPARKPSKEMPMHRAIYTRRPEVNAVLHASPFYATLVACSGLELPGSLFVEDMYYLERVERVGYRHPGSAALGDAVGEKAACANILLLENHGVLVYDTSIKEALMALHTLEMVCRMVLEAKSAGVDLRSLPPSTVSDFLNNSGYRPRRDWPA